MLTIRKSALGTGAETRLLTLTVLLMGKEPLGLFVQHVVMANAEQGCLHVWIYHSGPPRVDVGTDCLIVRQ